MNIMGLTEKLYNRYTAQISLVLVMLWVHMNLIQIHPLLFIVWPFCMWLVVEICQRWRDDPMKVFLFSSAFTLHLLATQLLVVENARGIFFDLDPFPNLAAISYYVLGFTVLVFLNDLITAGNMSLKEVPAYVGVASVIPWVSPAVVELNILVRWLIDGNFAIRTAGKGLGASSLNDILFVYGTRNFAYSLLIFSSSVALLRFRELVMIRLQTSREKRLQTEQEREWFADAWANPLNLLSPNERSSFIESHEHLDEEQRNAILREKILPEKGIRLIDPDAF